MEPKRVYISKSKAGNPDLLQDVRHQLKTKYNVRVAEFQGGQDSSNLLKSCELLIVVPPELPKAFTRCFNVGKGQYIEIITAQENSIPVILITSKGDGFYYIASTLEVILLEVDWSLNWAQVHFKNTKEITKEIPLIKKVTTNIISRVKPMLALFPKYSK
jgi:hypothetical protein